VLKETLSLLVRKKTIEIVDSKPLLIVYASFVPIKVSLLNFVDMTETKVPWKRKNKRTLNSWEKMVYRSDKVESLFTLPSI
jgi:hypothetical protein